MMPIAPDLLPQETFDEVYRSLFRALRRKKGFGLFFVVQSDYRQVNQTIEKLRRDLPQKKISLLLIKRETQKLYDQIAEQRQAEGFDILVIRGIEQALYEYEDTKRLSGWSSTEIYTYSWKGVPPILSHLNQQRERFGTDFPCSFVFVVSSFVLNYFIQRAPDFFDWRSGLFHFPLTEEERQVKLEKLSTGNLNKYLNLAPEERVIKSLELKNLIDESSNSSETTAKLFFENGLLFLSGKHYDKAIVNFDSALKINPQHEKILLTKTLSLIILERYEEAITDLHTNIKLKSNNFLIWSLYGFLLMCMGRFEESLASYDQAITLNSDDYDVWKNRGIVLSELERYEEAIASYEQAISLNSHDYEVWKNRGIVLWELEQYEKAIASYEQAIALNSDDYMVWTNRGIALGYIEQYEEAIASYDQAINLNSDDYMVWHMWGVALGKLERYEEAISSFDQAIALNSHDYEVWKNHGIVLCELEQYEKAISSYDQAITLNSDDYMVWNIRGITLGKLERYEEAISSFDQAIALNSHDYAIWSNRGVALGELERYEEAISSFDQAISLNSNDYKTWENRGLILGDLERYEEAIEDYKKVICIKPKFISAYNRMSCIYYKQKHWSLAVDCLIRATLLNPEGDSVLWNNLGFLYLIKNKPQKAKSYLHRSLQMQRNSFLPIFNLALVHVISNKFKETKRLIRKSLNYCQGEDTQEKLYIALSTIALGQKQDGLQNLQDILRTLTNPSEIGVIRGGVLESAEILARYPSQFPGIDQALAMLKQTLHLETKNQT
ncbi:tetratricopeptide repeat protein [Coleofasciculus sp. G2-EDA-02]|uniref:tetratricopeptide repeat protein n=1 Tax=Coleofasciculus sp. G2-EDA-02 TaxID=3069529 RepID=UPI0032F508EF